ncbi:hypothetical protein AGMMS49546_34840 [Spirochaetia bacterium]|nr:hypothetical protein AGMMS49546_34840 [Spirochaetia bacterium]
MSEWYQRRFRRNLIDMHIEEWDKSFLSRFEPDDYFNNLVKANVNAPMIYFQAHTGLCYWPTKTGKMHAAFEGREDAMRKLVDKCYGAGMDVIAYYSLVYNNWAYEQHPDWQLRNVNNHGSRYNGNRYGLCCPNSQGYRDFTAKQIAEFSDYFRFEGIFLDMTFWPMVCYCDSCKARWEKEVGGEMPKVVDWNDPKWLTFQRKRIEWLGEFAQFATAEIKKHKPNCAVEHQYSTGVNHFWRFGVTENISQASDYAGGDLYGGIAEQSYACKVYYNLTRNQPFEYMTSRCYPKLREHTTNKSMDLLRLSVMLTYMHHGACLLIDAIDPVGTIDNRVYKKIGEIFRETEPYEPYFSIGKPVSDVGLYLNLFGRMDPLANGVPVGQANDSSTSPHEKAVMEAAESLRSHHVPYSVLNNWKLELLPNVKVLVLSDIPFMDDKEISAIKDFIRNGGSAYISGRTCPKLVEDIFGIKYEGFTEHTVTYISPTREGIPVMQGEYTREYPLVMFEQQAQYSGKPSGVVFGTTTLPGTVPNPANDFINIATQPGDTQKDLNSSVYRFVSIHSNPPVIFTDKPAMFMTDYGKGSVFYSALPIERAKREQHSDIFAGIIKLLLKGAVPAFSSNDAPETVECIMFEDKEKGVKLLGLVNIQDSFHTIPVKDFTISVQAETAPKEVVLLPKKDPVPFQYKDKLVYIHIRSLSLYSMFLLQF